LNDVGLDDNTATKEWNVSEITRNDETLNGEFHDDQDLTLDHSSHLLPEERLKDTQNTSTHMVTDLLRRNILDTTDIPQRPNNRCGVTVYGFPLSERAFIHRKFAEYGRLLQCSADQNALHIVYDDENCALQALQEDGTWVDNPNGHPYLIGVKYSEWIRPNMYSEELREIRGSSNLRQFVENKNIEKSLIVQDESMVSKFVSFWTQGW